MTRLHRSSRRPTHVFAGLLAVIALVAGSTSANADTTRPPDEISPTRAEKIKPKLQRQLETEGRTDFWVRFDDSADLSHANQIEDWNERGAWVAERLRETADKSQAKVRAQLTAKGAEYEAFWATNAIHVSAGSQKLAMELASLPEVDSIHPTTTYEVPPLEEDPKEDSEAGTAEDALAETLNSAVEWGIANINADDVWEQYGVTGEGITVANIDTGVDFSHTALVNQYRGNLGGGEFDHNYNWFDAAGRCADAPCDNDGHGTHTMGTMAGDDGAQNKIGVAPGVTWIAANGCCPGDAELIASGQWMLEPTDLNGVNPDASKRPHIVNNSWGSEFVTNDPFMEDIALAWEASGIFAMWSNGNHGPACRTSGSPGSRTINYSAGAYDVNNNIADFSSRGSGQDDSLKPNIAAPGADVRSSVPGDRYDLGSGTSMAAPHVAGAVALLWSASPALIGDIDETRARLDETAVDRPDETCGGTPDDNSVYGEGRLDALALVDSAQVGDTGTLSVAVTDAKSGEPVPDADVVITGLAERERRTGDDGMYSLPLPPGDYSVVIEAFGYQGATADITVRTGETTTVDRALQPLPTVEVTGRVADGSGHGWPLYATLTVDGMPAGTFHTKPTNGKYGIELPAGQAYEITVDPAYEGYQTVTETVTVGSERVTHDIAVPVDNVQCLDAGYEYSYDGFTENFDDGAPDGWTITDNLGNGNVWRFDDPNNEGNLTGGEGGFAIAQSPGFPDRDVDTTMTTPTVDLTGHDEPVLIFRQDFLRLRAVGHVDLSVDGGDTWETVLEQTSSRRGPRQELIPITQAADQPDVRARFHAFDAAFSTRHWEIDDVFVGTRTCEPVPTGLVVGHVSDRNTGDAVNGATVTSDNQPDDSVRTIPTPDDAKLDDGFYWMFSSQTGRQPISAVADEFATDTRKVSVAESKVTEHDVRLRAGQISVDQDVTVSVREGDAAKGKFTVTNTGSAPVNLEFRERDGQFDIPRVASTAGSAGAEIVRVPGEFSPLAAGAEPELVRAPATAPTGADGSAWIDMPGFPDRVMDNAVVVIDGKIYSAGGRNTSYELYESFVYDPDERGWSRIADLPAERQSPAGVAYDGKFYVVGGWGVGFPDAQGTKTTYIYDPATDTWSTGADAPNIFAAAGQAVVDDQLYIVGGCTNSCNLSRVLRYDLANDSWERIANYPDGASHLACGGIDGTVYCTGGTRAGGIVWNQTYAYDPATDTWSRKADLPIQLWGMATTVSSDRFLVSGGVTGGRTDFTDPGTPTALTNEGFVYEPATDTWISLPASNNLTYRSGDTCGLIKVGGTMVVGFAPVDTVEMLPTYGDCVPVDVPWLTLDQSSVTLAPGEKIQVTVDVDSSGLDEGDHEAGAWIKEDTPYLTYPVDVTATVISRKG